MNNKKLKIFIIGVLIIQLLLPAGLLIYQQTLNKNATESSAEFRFKLANLSIWNYGEVTLNFSIEDISLSRLSNFYGEDIAVTVGADGIAELRIAENKKDNKHWFSYDNYQKLESFSLADGEFSYADSPEAREIIDNWPERLYHEKDEILNYRGGNTMFLTAKVYKGLFIPTAIYNEDVKIIDLHK